MVRITCFDPQGRAVATPLHEARAAGSGEVNWDGRNPRGQRVAQGVYFIRLDTSAGSVAIPAVVFR